ncbi:MAG: LytTR family DNA-binding domain-containing protein [Betaproteobacteria bacterium]
MTGRVSDGKRDDRPAMTKKITAMIADDEPLLRESLTRLLAQTWPELEVIAQARNGRAAVESFEAQRPDICFLDVHMPGLSGIEAARFIGRRAHVVFVTAYDQYAVQAFDQGALDYLVKPVELARLMDTVARLKERLRAAPEIPDTAALLDQLAARVFRNAPPSTLNWLRVSVGQALRLVSADEIDFLRSEDKYTLVAWHDPAGQVAEGLVRTPLKELISQLDPAQFVQVHRSVVVNLRAIKHVLRGHNETANIHLKHRADVLPVSRTFLHYFRMM